ncbi:MAG: adenylosuccinate lyase [Planctomycetes bacterium]|nr:adenylosuccinate lyase [Planctomycetota bacterium]MCB9889413.1 adenylosuccinate lyase [Planctomycetota bacterium]
MAEGERFDHPLIERYAGRRMAQLFSPRSRHGAWRELWIALAGAQKQLGLPITDDQLAELRARRDEFDWAAVARYESEVRHDVMAHVLHYGDLAPAARPILHLGATSCFVTDNGDLILFRRALRMLETRLCRVIAALSAFAREHRGLACLGYTHFQVAQPVTVGKRATLWIQDLLLDLDEVRRVVEWLPCRGVKGTTGTQATFLSLFDGDHGKVRRLEALVAAAIGFERTIPVSGQTYSRKIDWTIHALLSGIAQSGAKFANDVRLLSHEGELEEPSESKQIGSSAMAYKKNPMRCERINSLARYVLAGAQTSAQTTATQWLERTLDDSAVRRMALPEGFLAVDGILRLMENVAAGMVVWPRVIARNLAEHLPFLTTEEILMAGVRAGGDRQDLHERVRVHSREAVRQIKAEGRPNPLLELIAGDPAFAAIRAQLPELTDPARCIGRSPEQVDEFLAEEVEPRLAGVDLDAEPGDELRV